MKHMILHDKKSIQRHWDNHPEINVSEDIKPLHDTKHVSAVIKIELNDQILFDRPNSLFVGRIIEMTEKALKVDYAMEPIFAGSGMNSVVVFKYRCWIPKSVIIDDRGSLTVKKWFASQFTGGIRIKHYFINEKGQHFI